MQTLRISGILTILLGAIQYLLAMSAAVIIVSLFLGWSKGMRRTFYYLLFDWIDVLIGISVGVYLFYIWATDPPVNRKRQVFA